jgi:hypothetical protein
MSASKNKSARGRRARSMEDESPIVVTSIAILGLVVFSCMGLIAPILWTALVDSPGPRWSEQSCSQGTAAAGAAKCPDRTRFQSLWPRPGMQLEPLIPHL